jgi:HlyD family secretion protein
MKQFDRSSGGKSSRAGQTVYTLSPGGLGEPKAVEIRAGITDSRFTQVVSGDLKAGDTIVVGLATTKADAGARPPGGASGPGGGRRF